MARYEYKYHGTISGAMMRNKSVDEITLWNMADMSQAPTRLTVFGKMGEYLYKLECTDYEERYIDADFFYDECLHLTRIEIPSTDPSRPARIIKATGSARFDLAVYGGHEWAFIDDPNPEPMPWEEYHRYLSERWHS